MNKTSFVLIFAFLGVALIGLGNTASALGPCETEAGQCNRQADIEFRHDRIEMGDNEARNILDGRRSSCRTVMKKCRKVATRRRDLKLGYGNSLGDGGSTTQNSSPGY